MNCRASGRSWANTDVASIVEEERGGATQGYLMESAWAGGKLRILSQEYLGTAEKLAAMPGGGRRPRTGSIIQISGDRRYLRLVGRARRGFDHWPGEARRADADPLVGTRAGTGTKLDWQIRTPCRSSQTGGPNGPPQFTKIPASVQDYRRLRDVTHAVTVEWLKEISDASQHMVSTLGLDCSRLLSL